jgi:N-acetylglucosamine transport system permease protein
VTATTNEPAVKAQPKPAKRGPRELRFKPLNAMSHLSLALWALLIIGPLLFAFFASSKSNTEIFLGNPFSLPERWSLDAFGRAWTEAKIGTYFINSVIVVGASTFGTMLLGAMAAYVLARYKFVGNRLIYFLFIAGLAFPVFLALTPLYLIMREIGLLGTHFGLVLVYIAWSLPFTVFFLAAFFKTLPNAVAEAAQMDGASHTRLFFQVMVPMAKPGLISITIFNLIGQWNQYLLPVALMQSSGSDVGSEIQDKWLLTQGIANISISAGYQADWSALFAALTIAIIPMIIMYSIFQRQIQSGLTAGAVK